MEKQIFERTFRLLIAGGMMISAMVPTSGQAFTDSDFKYSVTQFGKCQVLERIQPNTPFAGVYVANSSGSPLEIAGGGIGIMATKILRIQAFQRPLLQHV